MAMRAPDPLADAMASGPTLSQALADAAGRLRDAGVESPRRDARLLLAEALSGGSGESGRSAGAPADPLVNGERPLGAAEARRFEALVERRRRREPVSRILGQRGFWSLELAVSPATLDPRPDSETLVEAVLARIAGRDRPRRLLDLGTGGGGLLLALLAELPGAWGLGSDISPRALETARRNAEALGLGGRARFLAGDWGAALAGAASGAGWDVILCNPPYIASGEIAGLAPEVARFEPRAALDGGPDGLQAYRRVLPEIARLLAPGGLAAVELGAGQGESVEKLARDSGLRTAARLPDLAGVERCLLIEGRLLPGKKGRQRKRKLLDC